jgi:hypothetical protein
MARPKSGRLRKKSEDLVRDAISEGIETLYQFGESPKLGYYRDLLAAMKQFHTPSDVNVILAKFEML